MLEQRDVSGIKKGRFIWREKDEQQAYIKDFENKIESRYYFSEEVLTGIVERIAPMIGEAMDPDLADNI